MLGTMHLTVAEAIDRGEDLFAGLESQKKRKNSRQLPRNIRSALGIDDPIRDEIFRRPSLALRRSSGYSKKETLQGDNNNGCQDVSPYFSSHSKMS